MDHSWFWSGHLYRILPLGSFWWVIVLCFLLWLISSSMCQSLPGAWSRSSCDASWFQALDGWTDWFVWCLLEDSLAFSIEMIQCHSMCFGCSFGFFDSWGLNSSWLIQADLSDRAVHKKAGPLEPASWWGFYCCLQSERRDLNPRPPLPQSGALPSCATPRIFTINIKGF